LVIWEIGMYVIWWKRMLLLLLLLLLLCDTLLAIFSWLSGFNSVSKTCFLRPAYFRKGADNLTCLELSTVWINDWWK
jgi:hypothetical protein